MNSKKGMIETAVMAGVGIVVAVIAIGAVAYPVILSSINKSLLSGATGISPVDATIASYLPTMLLVGLLIAIIGIGILSFIGRK